MAQNDQGLTPMMKQFYSFKAKHPDALLLFRCGDFYETYSEDAKDHCCSNRSYNNSYYSWNSFVADKSGHLTQETAVQALQKKKEAFRI